MEFTQNVLSSGSGILAISIHIIFRYTLQTLHNIGNANDRFYSPRCSWSFLVLSHEAFMAAKGMRERHGMHCSKIRNVVPRRVGASLKGIVNLPGFTFFCLIRLFSTLFFFLREFFQTSNRFYEPSHSITVSKRYNSTQRGTVVLTWVHPPCFGEHTLVFSISPTK